MPRKYGTTATEIWRDDEFRARSAAAQRVYWLLYSQPDISAAGVLALTVRRWAKLAPDTTEADVTAAIEELAQHRYLVVDTDTEELLVRSFVRWDGGHSNPKRRPAILAAAQAVTSEWLRWALAEEFARLGLATDGLPDRQPHCLSGGLPGARLVPVDEAADAGWHLNSTETTSQAAFPQVNNLSDTQSDSHADCLPDRPRAGARATNRNHNPQPATATHNPQPVRTAARSSLAPRERDATWDAVMAVCGIDTTAIPGSARGAYNRAVKDLKAAGATPEQITDRAANYAARWPNASLTPTALARRWPEVAQPVRQLPRADQRTQRNAALVERFRAAETSNHHNPEGNYL